MARRVLVAAARGALPLALGPWFPLRLHASALAGATPRERRWIVSEIAAVLGLALAAFAFLDLGWLRYHVLAMAAGQCLTAFFAVWTVHRGCTRDGVPARTLRSPLKSALAYDMFYHLEHHLFPRVPTRRLAVLAKRLDAALPGLEAKQVF